MKVIAWLVVLILLLGGWYLARSTRVKVPRGKVGIVRRNFALHSDPDFHGITPRNDTRGTQARVLRPEHVYWLVPVVHSVKFVPLVHVPDGQIGIVTAKAGRGRQARQPFGRAVQCDNFQNGRAFLTRGGEQGRQIATLSGGQSYLINTELFRVDLAPRTYVPPGTVGVVKANAGLVRPPDRAFGRHVPCDDFQDGHAFLDGGGEQGKQLAILGGGASYDINPGLFEVFTVDNTASSSEGLMPYHLTDVHIEVGYTGVVLTLDGAPPAQPGTGTVAPLVEGHHNFRYPWVFLENGGRRGVQAETLQEGTVYSLNPWFIQVIPVPTRVLSLEWSSKAPSESRNYDADLEQITVNIQGYQIDVEIKQSLQIPEKVAPTLVSQFGGTRTTGLGGLVHDPVPVQRFVERVLGSAVERYFGEITGAATVAEFVRKRRETRTDLTAQVRNALLAWGVDAKETTLGVFRSEDPSLNEALKQPFHEGMRLERLREKHKATEIEDQIDVIQVRAEQRRAALELEAEIKALGPENVAMIRIIREISKMQVPDIIGGGDISSYVQALPLPAVRDMIGRLRELRQENRLGPDAGPSIELGKDEGNDPPAIAAGSGG